MPISDELRTALRRDKRSSNEIAEEVGMHPVNLSQFITGRRRLPLTTVERMAEVLGYRIHLEPRKSRQKLKSSGRRIKPSRVDRSIKSRKKKSRKSKRRR